MQNARLTTASAREHSLSAPKNTHNLWTSMYAVIRIIFDLICGDDRISIYEYVKWLVITRRKWTGRHCWTPLFVFCSNVVRFKVYRAFSAELKSNRIIFRKLQLKDARGRLAESVSWPSNQIRVPYIQQRLIGLRRLWRLGWSHRSKVANSHLVVPSWLVAQSTDSMEIVADLTLSRRQ